MKKKHIIIIIFIILLLVLSLLLFRKQNKDIKEMTPINESDFNLSLIKNVNQNQKDNYLISPYSIKVALNMLNEGAYGNTKKEIEKVLNNEPINEISNKNIKVANAIFVKNKYKPYIETNFYNNIKNKYNGEVLFDEFKTPKVINDWVNKHTDKMIPSILKTIPSNFILGLANAIAIDAKWASAFECNNTLKEEFTKIDNTKINTEMMHKTLEDNRFSYFKTNNATGVILPYQQEDNLEFIAILPNNNAYDYINNLTQEELLNIDKSKKEANNKLHINLSIPRFTYDYDLANFMKVLYNMGIKDAFNEDVANFNMIIEKDNYGKAKIHNIFVDTAIHKTHIELNETGTKAAAVTYFGLKDSAAILPPDDIEQINIKFNKPFIYIIRHQESKELLFFGVVNSPNKWNGTTCQNID